MEKVPKPVYFEATANPLGNELDLVWDFGSPLPTTYQIYIFKRSKISVTEAEIVKYITSPAKESVAAGLFVFRGILNDQNRIIDMKVESGQTYFYSLIVVKRGDVGLRSEIVEVSAEATDFKGEINVVPTKALVMEAVKKILSAVAKQSSANIMVYNDFPLEVSESAFVTVSRTSGENAYRYWSDISASYGPLIVTGELDTDVIQVTWLAQMNPTLRDKLTDIFRGSKRILKRYLRMSTGLVLDANITVIGDGQEAVDGKNLNYGSMLVNVLIQNQMKVETGSELLTKILYEFEYSIDTFDN